MSSPELLHSLPLVVIVGPTSVGKTELAIRLADHLNGEIVSADSRLFYRGMDIGTAKPTPEERSRVPHHLIDVADPRETWSLSVFQQAAVTAISGIRARLPFLVGGTGQYIHAVTNGWLPPTVVPNQQLRAILEVLASTRGNDWLHHWLIILDPLSAKSIDPRNVRRTIRALEVIFSTGHKFSMQRGHNLSPYRLLTIGLTCPRKELYFRVDARIEAMFSSGFLEEVKHLLESGCTPDMPSLSAIGYRECVQVLQGKLSVDQAKVQMRKLTRIFVRRQANWFKLEDLGIHWFTVSELSTPNIENLVKQFVS
jgi:tRNA dimethylallyltransferase